eukprot:scaffold77492_cov20-Tisochrysis_lutea.AAC.3
MLSTCHDGTRTFEVGNACKPWWQLRTTACATQGTRANKAGKLVGDGAACSSLAEQAAAAGQTAGEMAGAMRLEGVWVGTWMMALALTQGTMMPLLGARTWTAGRMSLQGRMGLWVGTRKVAGARGVAHSQRGEAL